MQIKTVEGDREVASRGVAGTALGLGIAGTVGLLNQWANGGFGFGFGNGFGNGWGFGNRNFGFGPAMAVGLSDAVANYDTRTIGCLESKIARLESERYTDGVGIELYKEIVAKTNANDARIQSNFVELAKEVAHLDKKIAVDKKETECNFAFLNHRIDDTARELRNYVDATFVPGELKMPLSSICPEAMRRYNSWVAPTTPAPDTVTANVTSYEGTP